MWCAINLGELAVARSLVFPKISLLLGVVLCRGVVGLGEVDSGCISSAVRLGFLFLSTVVAAMTRAIELVISGRANT